MARYLIDVVETHRADSEEEAALLIEEAKNSSKYTLLKYTSVYKERKSKGEVIDAYYKVTLTKRFDDEKDPTNNIEVQYKAGAF